MLEQETQSVGRKRRNEIEERDQSPSSNIIARTFSSIFKRRRQSSPVKDSSSTKESELKTGTNTKQSDANSKLTSPLPRLNLASTRLIKSSNKNGDHMLTSQFEKKQEIETEPRFEIGQSDKPTTQSRMSSTGISRYGSKGRRDKYSRSQILSSEKMPKPPVTSLARGYSRSRSSRLMRHSSSIGTFSIDKSQENSNSTSYTSFTNGAHSSYVATNATYTSRLLERKRKVARRRKDVSSMNIDLVNRILAAGDGLLYPKKPESTDLGPLKITDTNSNPKQSMKVSVVGKYKVGGPRWNQHNTNSTSSSVNEPKPPAKAMSSLNQSFPLPSASTSQARGVRFQNNFESKTPKSKPSTHEPPKHMPLTQTPAAKKTQKNSVANDIVKSTSIVTPKSGKKRNIADADNEFSFQPTPRLDARPELNDEEKSQIRLRYKKVKFEFSTESSPVRTKKKEEKMRVATPYPNKQKASLLAHTPIKTLTTPTATKAVSSTPASGGWGAHMFAKAGEWSCNACLSKNPKEAKKCLACDTKKKGEDDVIKGGGEKLDKLSSQGKSFPVSKNNDIKSGSASTDGGFTFGSPSATSASGGVTFGSQNKNTKSDPNSNTIFSFGTQNNNDNKEEAKTIKTKTGGFTFGVQNSDDTNEERKATTNAIGGITFRAQNSNDKKELPKVTSSVSGGFTFGVQNSDDKKEKTKLTTSSIGGFNFGPQNRNDKKEEPKSTTSSTGLFTFGSQNSNDKKKESKLTTTSTGIFTFGSQNSNDKKEESKSASSSTGGFTFETQNINNKREITEVTKPSTTSIGGFTIRSQNGKDKESEQKNDSIAVLDSTSNKVSNESLTSTSGGFNFGINTEKNATITTANGTKSFGNAKDKGNDTTASESEKKGVFTLNSDNSSIGDKKKFATVSYSSFTPKSDEAKDSMEKNKINKSKVNLSTSMFGKSDTVLSSETKQKSTSAFSFGQSTSTATTSLFGSPQPALSNSTNNDGGPSRKRIAHDTSSDNENKSSTAFSFGSSTSSNGQIGTAQSRLAQPNVNGTSMSVAATTPSSNNTTTGPSFQFGSTEPSSKKPFTFGSSSTSLDPTTPLPTATQPKTSFSFAPASSSVVTSTPAQPFTFGSTTPAPAPNPTPVVNTTKPLAFGSQQSAPSASGFSFGQPQPQAATPQTSFAFNGAISAPSAPAVPSGSQSTFTFGSNSSMTPAAPIAPAPAPQFNSGGFGAQTMTPSTGGFGTSAPPSNGFSSGFAQNTIAAAGGGFSIGTGGGTKTRSRPGATVVRRRTIKAKRPPSLK